MARKPLKNEVKPAKPHLTRGTGGLAGEVLDLRNDLTRVMDRIETEFPLIEQSERFDLWLDGANGDDANDGLTEATAVKTPKRLSALIPKMIATELFVVNVRGPLALTAADNAVLWFNTLSNSDGVLPKIVIIGDKSSRQTILDNGSGGNIVSDINAAGQVGLTTATWTENEHRGYWCEFKTGPLAGESRVVDHNDGTKLYLMNCPDDPGVGAEFILSAPLTEVSSGPFWMGEDQLFAAILNGPGELYMTDLHFTGGATFGVENTQNLGTSWCVAARIIVKGDASFFGFVIDGGGLVALDTDDWDVTIPVPTHGYGTVGVSVSQYPPVGAVWIYCSGISSNWSALIPEANIWYCNNNFQWYTSSVHAATLLCSRCPGHGGGAFGSYGAGYLDLPTRFGGHRAFGVPTPDRPAIEMYDSEADFQKSKIVDSTMALRMIGSKAVIQEAEGNDHTVCGVHADAHSAIFLPPGTVPTLAGNGGAVELSEDGTTEKAKWAAIAGVAASGDITAVAKANLLDNETFVLDDGVNPATTFEFQVTGGFVPTGGGVLVIDVTLLTTADEVAAAIAAAINAVGAGLAITAGTPTGAVTPLTNDAVGIAGNVAIVDTVTDAGFTHNGMTGGVDVVAVSTPEVVCREYAPTWTFSFPV